MTPIDLGDSSSADTLQLMVGNGQGQPELLLLLERPTQDGKVRVRSWSSDDWSAAPRTEQRTSTDLLRDVERWARERRGLNHPLSVVRRWLNG